MIEELIEKKRRGEFLTKEEFLAVVTAYNQGTLTDDDMAAFLRFVYEDGLTYDEIASLTAAEIASGTRIEWSDDVRPLVDKHSTGGVGDTVTLIVVPWAASLGIHVPKLSGRSLGHTGGTIDKFASIPGVRVELSRDEFSRQVTQVGAAIAEPFGELCPVEAKIYALRDARGLIDSVPLITASILSKKIAAGADTFVFDVKAGQGAFMKTAEDAEVLARHLVEVSRRFDKRCVCVITRMDTPLGRAVGNALEVEEAIDFLGGSYAPDMYEVSHAIALEMALAAGWERENAERELEAALRTGAALDAFVRIVKAQGGPSTVEDIRKALPRAQVKGDYLSEEKGVLIRVDVEAAARAARLAGGTGSRPETGLVFRVKPGERVQIGDVLCEIHASSFENLDWAADALENAFVISDVKYEPPPRVIQVIRSDEVVNHPCS